LSCHQAVGFNGAEIPTKNGLVIKDAVGYEMEIWIMLFATATEAAANGKEQDEAQTRTQARSEAAGPSLTIYIMSNI
jgi:hypothetical protein